MAEKQTVARPYAKAVFDLAQEAGELESWSQSLTMLAAIASDSDMGELLSNPEVDRDKLIELITSIGGEQLNGGATSLLKVLAESDRMVLLPEIAELFEQEHATITGSLEAEVISATKLTETQRQNISAALSKRFDCIVTLDCKVDESIIGGAIIRAGDIVIDGSVTARLEKLAINLNH
jgi:F-type H+-transporting ATPase subunit delta